MRIEFSIDGVRAEFRRNCFTGRAELVFDDHVIPIESPLNPRTHCSLKLKCEWRHRMGSHEVVIEKTRPRFMAGLRPQSYRVLVDEQVVEERVGY